MRQPDTRRDQALFEEDRAHASSHPRRAQQQQQQQQQQQSPLPHPGLPASSPLRPHLPRSAKQQQQQQQQRATPGSPKAAPLLRSSLRGVTNGHGASKGSSSIIMSSSSSGGNEGADGPSEFNDTGSAPVEGASQAQALSPIAASPFRQARAQKRQGRRPVGVGRRPAAVQAGQGMGTSAEVSGGEAGGGGAAQGDALRAVLQPPVLLRWEDGSDLEGAAPRAQRQHQQHPHPADPPPTPRAGPGPSAANPLAAGAAQPATAPPSAANAGIAAQAGVSAARGPRDPAPQPAARRAAAPPPSSLALSIPARGPTAACASRPNALGAAADTGPGSNGGGAGGGGGGGRPKRATALLAVQRLKGNALAAQPDLFLPSHMVRLQYAMAAAAAEEQQERQQQQQAPAAQVRLEQEEQGKGAPSPRAKRARRPHDLEAAAAAGALAAMSYSTSHQTAGALRWGAVPAAAAHGSVREASRSAVQRGGARESCRGGGKGSAGVGRAGFEGKAAGSQAGAQAAAAAANVVLAAGGDSEASGKPNGPAGQGKKRARAAVEEASREDRAATRGRALQEKGWVGGLRGAGHLAPESMLVGAPTQHLLCASGLAHT